MTKKKLIMESALQLFAEQGFESTSIQQITDKCGISKGAFYLSFKSKETLILALIDQFLNNNILEIEQSVNNATASDDLLYLYYKHSFSCLGKHASIAKLFLMEQKTTCNAEIFEKLAKYNSTFNDIVGRITRKQFPELAENRVADIIYLIQAFIRGYSELFILEDTPVDIDRLCRSLAEKVTIIANYGQTTCISNQWLQLRNYPTLTLSKEELILFLQQAQEDTNDELIEQSIHLLCLHVQAPSLPFAVEQGLLKNLREDATSAWVAYMYEISNRP